MGRKSQKKMTGLSYNERKERAKKGNIRYQITKYLNPFRRNRNSGLPNNARDGIPKRLPSIFQPLSDPKLRYYKRGEIN